MKYPIPVVILALFFLAMSSCAPKVPIPVTEYGKMDASETQNLLILLRGRGGSHQDFEKYGIIDEVRKRELPFDIVVPHAHFGYYRTESLHERLKYDIVEPARARGYRNIWLAGFSMGGLGGLFYLASYPSQDLDGLILCSPFVGWRAIRSEIEKQGGIKKWVPGEGHDHENWQYRLWEWVKRYQYRREDYPDIFLGYAEPDYVTGNGPALLAEAMDPGKVFVIKGGHDYQTFQALWRTHLDRLEERFKSEKFGQASTAWSGQ